MRYLSEETKERIVHFIDSYYADNGYTPTIAEIAAGIRMSDATVHKYLHRMNDAGELSFDGRISSRIALQRYRKIAPHRSVVISPAVHRFMQNSSTVRESFCLTGLQEAVSILSCVQMDTL